MNRKSYLEILISDCSDFLADDMQWLDTMHGKSEEYHLQELSTYFNVKQIQANHIIEDALIERVVTADALRPTDVESFTSNSACLIGTDVDKQTAQIVTASRGFESIPFTSIAKPFDDAVKYIQAQALEELKQKPASTGWSPFDFFRK